QCWRVPSKTSQFVKVSIKPGDASVSRRRDQFVPYWRPFSGGRLCVGKGGRVANKDLLTPDKILTDCAMFKPAFLNYPGDDAKELDSLV
ncbi:unnamed protein product, partial [Ectocarpus sp. 8 AP-2014]